jgi:SulP family sulfate permease
MLFFAKYAAFLPKAAMGGIILLVGYNLIDFKHIKLIFKSSKREVIVLSTTFLGTLFLDLQQALVIGIFFSLFFYLERTSKPNIAVLGLDSAKRFINIIRDKKAKECPQLNIIRVDGSLYFGAVESISNYFSDLYENNDGKHLLVIAEGINFIDLAGAEWLMNEVKKWETTNRVIYFSGMKLVSQNVLIKGGFFNEIGRDHFYKDKKTAIKAIYQKLDKKVCETCEVNAFLECSKKQI